MPKPWERQTGESDSAYEAFCCYRDLGSKRSLVAVDRALNPASAASTTGKAVGQQRARGHINGWSSKFDWPKRARAWDDELDRHNRERQLDEVAKMAKRHATNAQALEAALSAPVQSFLRALTKPDVQARLSAEAERDPLAFAGFAALAAKVLPRLQEAERIARGARVKIDPKADSIAGGNTEWTVEIYSPPRDEAPQLEQAGADMSTYEDEIPSDSDDED